MKPEAYRHLAQIARNLGLAVPLPGEPVTSIAWVQFFQRVATQTTPP